jgi:hypothetical protein
VVRNLNATIQINLNQSKTMSNSQSTARQIATQSNLKFMLEYIQLQDVKLTLKEIAAAVNVLNDFVENGYSKEVGARFDKIDEYIKECKK